ncbi:MAG TPA: hypothetical protein VFI72_10010 [Candidatus Angelobacter sp.]|nr:hypothetical protein [Candidatus Angelobacter sp.]
MKRAAEKQPSGNALNIEEVRLVADLRVMHAKVDELFQLVSNLKRRHDERAVRMYADREVLDEDIRRVDEIYLWFVKMKDEGIRLKIG